MVLAFLGQDHPVESVARLARDPRHDIYGNWPRNVQAAFSLGIPGEVRRFDNWPEVERTLRQGSPIIASIRALPGELPAAPYNGTDGHLIVLTGFDANGDIFVNDPAVSTPSEGQRIYPRRDLTTVWLIRGKGTAYILHPPENPR